LITKPETPLDLLWGCRAIAAEINRTERATFNLLETGQLPAKKVGNTWVAVRGKLHALFDGEAA
jgi:hypothetical protein